MTELLFQLTGGIGLFLLGMVLLTDGVKTLAGDALRRALVRFTGTPLKAFGSGALVTALVQSSSATTVTVIGFVSAGLLTFPQAVGVVMGASLGTTATGWIVAVLGLKISVGFYALPLVGAGAFCNLLGRGRLRPLGLALAGFGLIFIGIETLQTGMGGLSGVFNLAALPSGGPWAGLLMIAIGVVLTVIMQSSSAAIATTLTALHTGSINFDQAATLVIGAAIGTTITGVLAAIGGGVPAKRTALAHVLFNTATGIIAICLLPLFLRGIVWAQLHLGLEAGATSLAAFHTAFIGFGVLVFLPLARPFAARIERLLPDRGPALTRHLDTTLGTLPAVALEASARALHETAAELFDLLADRTAGVWNPQNTARSAAVAHAIEKLKTYIADLPPVPPAEPMARSRLGQLHAIDHLLRLQPSLEPAPDLATRDADPALRDAIALTREILALGRAGLHNEADDDWSATVADRSGRLSELRRQARADILNRTAGGELDTPASLALLDAMRWLDGIGYHAWRICAHLTPDQPDDQPARTA